MTKLEQKLKELGYKQHNYFKRRYIKEISYLYIAIQLDSYGVKITDYFANDKQSKKEMQKDLEILKECE